MRKGLWSPEEDENLKQYVIKHGNLCWSDVPKKTGLQRSGKSCRLRWLNYLRPGRRICKFSSDEIKLVMELHKIYGNRWSDIAKHMDGRTNNDVKNLWNSKIRRLLPNLNINMVNAYPNELGHPSTSPNFPTLVNDKEEKHLIDSKVLTQRKMVFPFICDLNTIRISSKHDQSCNSYLDFNEKPMVFDINVNSMHGLELYTDYNKIEYSKIDNSSKLINTLGDGLGGLETGLEKLINSFHSCKPINANTNQDQVQEYQSLNHLQPPWYNQQLNGELAVPNHTALIDHCVQSPIDMLHPHYFPPLDVINMYDQYVTFPPDFQDIHGIDEGHLMQF